MASYTSFLSGTPIATGNTAIYMPVWFPEDVTVYAIRFMATNGTGNYDLGLYDSSFARLASSGSTAMTAAGVKSLTLSDLHLVGGDLYYVGFALSLNTGAAICASFVTAPPMIAAGFAQQATALPLPNPMVPAAMGGNLYPLINFGVR